MIEDDPESIYKLFQDQKAKISSDMNIYFKEFFCDKIAILIKEYVLIFLFKKDLFFFSSKGNRRIK